MDVKGRGNCGIKNAFESEYMMRESRGKLERIMTGRKIF